ncbi:MAG TPA: DUF6351 family protein [Burkholderiaceae bacterium]|nr:DUF6351 family protein [Burkholderiaceae bacterium]
MHIGLKPLVRAVALGGAALCLVTACSNDDDDDDFGEVAVEVRSSRPDFVSGGNALVDVSLPSGAAGSPGAALKVTLNGNDVTSVFEELSPDRRRGLLTGLVDGDNTLVASFGGRSNTVILKNHPIEGPMFSGPHETPFFCQTDSFALPDGSTLGPALDANCSAPTVVQYVYRTTSATTPAFRPLADPAQLPDDAAKVSVDGREVPYVVRVETGTINRAIYQISVLHDPASDPAPSPTTAPQGWNERLVYTFGGGCTGGWYRQGNTTGGVLDDNILKQGYAMASASLNVFGNNCQDLSAAETMAMVKEHFIEVWGPPRYTIGWGCSGGSYQQHQIADNYPGLLDGILPGCSFPEVGFATVNSITDARLLNHYFTDTAPGLFSEEQQRQVTGFLNLETMRTPTVNQGALRISPDFYCPAILPVEMRYDPVSNPTGVRCSVQDHTVNVYGRDPDTGFARRALDNVGIQYGLETLASGTISVDQFLDLNEKIGGYDADARFQPQRTVTDLQATRVAYTSGRLTNGGGGLKDVPIIDYRAYSDDNPIGDIHLRYHSFSVRERLVKANGHADNHLMLVEDFRYGYYSSASPMLLGALKSMDEWLARIAADTSNDPQSVKVVRNKPPTLVEGCLTRDPAAPVFIAEPQIRGQGQCEALYPSAPAPREVAGADVASDIIKCQLKPLSAGDYPVSFDSAQWARLQAVFPTGVCDWSKPGVEQQGLAGTWQVF